MPKNQYVVPHGKEWGVRGEGNSKLTKITSTKKEALEIAREITMHQQSELTILGQNGKIQDKESYGNDPCPPKDRKY